MLRRRSERPQQIHAQRQRRQAREDQPHLRDRRRDDRGTLPFTGDLPSFSFQPFPLAVDALALHLDRRLRFPLKLVQFLSALGVTVDQVLLNPDKLIPGLRLRFHQLALQLDHLFSGSSGICVRGGTHQEFRGIRRTTVTRLASVLLISFLCKHLRRQSRRGHFSRLVPYRTLIGHFVGHERGTLYPSN